MANNYALFSEKIDHLTDEEMDWLDKVLNADPEDEGELPKLLALLGTTEEEAESDALDNWPGFEFSINRQERSLWFYAEEGYDEEPLVTIFLAFLRRFRPTGHVAISVAYYCDKMRVGEFGGGWIVISANSVQSGSTWDSINDASPGYFKDLAEEELPNEEV